MNNYGGKRANCGRKKYTDPKQYKKAVQVYVPVYQLESIGEKEAKQIALEAIQTAYQITKELS